jgi:hypothetical protein
MMALMSLEQKRQELSFRASESRKPDTLPRLRYYGPNIQDTPKILPWA